MTKRKPFINMDADVYNANFLKGKEGALVRIYLNYSWPKGGYEFSAGAKKLEIREGKVLDTFDWKVPSIFPNCDGGASLLIHVDKKGCGKDRNARLKQTDYVGSYLYNKIGRIEVISSE